MSPFALHISVSRLQSRFKQVSKIYPGAFPRDRNLSERVFSIQWSLCSIYSQTDWKNARTKNSPTGKISEILGPKLHQCHLKTESPSLTSTLFLLRLSRRGKKRAEGATQFTYGKDRPFLVVPRVTGALAIRPYEGPGTDQYFLIARLHDRRARPRHQSSYPTENSTQKYGGYRHLYPTAPPQKKHRHHNQHNQRAQEIEDRILRQVQQVSVERATPTGPRPVDRALEVGNSRSRPSPPETPDPNHDQDFNTVTPLSRSHYNFLDGVHSRYQMGESEE